MDVRDVLLVELRRWEVLKAVEFVSDWLTVDAPLVGVEPDVDCVVEDEEAVPLGVVVTVAVDTDLFSDVNA